MIEQLKNDYKNYQQYLKCEGTSRKWYVQWSGPKDGHKDWFYYRSNARKHYNDIVQAGFKAETNACKPVVNN